MVKNNVGDVKMRKKLVVCPECGSTLKSENYSRHMERVHRIGAGGSARDFHYGAVIVVSVVLVLAISGLRLYSSSFGKNPPESIILPTITNTLTPATTNTVASSGQGRIRDGIMEIPVSEVGTSAKWHTYNSNGVNVRFFLVKGGDGKIHLATDACDVCYREKRGYRQTGAVMTCNNCGQTFAINTIGTGNLSGGCWPSYIPMKIEGNNVTIKTSDLDGKRSLFA
jgi:ribosomal protein S27E